MKVDMIILLFILYTVSSTILEYEVDIQKRAEVGELPQSANKIEPIDEDEAGRAQLEETPKALSPNPALGSLTAPEEKIQYQYRELALTEPETIILVSKKRNTVSLVIGDDMPGVKKAWSKGKGEFATRLFAHNKKYVSQGGAAEWTRVAYFFLVGYSSMESSQETFEYLSKVLSAQQLARKMGRIFTISWVDEHKREHLVTPQRNGLPSQRRRNLVGERITPRAIEPETLVQAVLLKGFSAMNKSRTARPGQIATLIDVPNAAVAHRRSTSTSLLQELSTQSKDVPQESTVGASAQFLETFAAFQAIQTNISNTIFPILIDMTSKTNSSLIFQAALSIWVDLTAAKRIIVGPFLQGLNCVNQLEIAQAKKLNMSINDPAFASYRAIGAILVDIYEDAWNRSFTAANSTGLLGKLYSLAFYLSENSNSTMAPESFRQIQNSSFDDTFFTDYNRNGDLSHLLA